MKRILIVDDDRDQLRLLSLLAGRAPGLTVKALDQFSAQVEDWSAYDLAIVDAMMPIISGPELICQQAAILGASMPRVILFSALSMLQLREMAEGLENVELMTKSGTTSQIAERLQSAARS